MARQTAAKRVSAKQVAIDVLRAAGEPLKAKEIATRVIASGRCGEQAESLAAYRGSLEAYERDARYPYLWEAARVGVARALRALGRAKEALPLLEQAVASAEAAGHPDRAFHEELAAAYADLGRTEEAAEQERLSALAGPGPFALWQARPRPPRSDPGS
jgi:tetratricopeptide (TPR) repeat protein